MSKKIRGVSAVLAAIALSAAGTASAEWLATDPGTPISLQVNIDGALVIRPVAGAWTHAVCADVSAAEFMLYSSDRGGALRRDALTTELLMLAAANGSRVNLFADPEDCDSHGHPVIRLVRVEGP